MNPDIQNKRSRNCVPTTITAITAKQSIPRLHAVYREQPDQLIQERYHLVAGSGRATEREYSRVNLLENAVAQPRYVSDFFTVRTAYEFIINNCPPRLDKSILQSCDINNYLTENISYAADMSDKIKEDMLQSVSIANGMVQAGERIVDRGEIIDNHTYNVLRSLKAIHEAKTGGTQTQGIILAGQFVLVFGLSSVSGSTYGLSA